MKVRIKFQKYGVMKFIGHLDVMRYFQKVMRRADIPIAFTQGFSPHMIMSFAQPLGVGVTSDGEYLDIELREPIASDKAISQMNAAMVDGITVSEFKQIPDEKKYSGMTMVAAATYRVKVLASLKDLEGEIAFPSDWDEKAKAFMAQSSIEIMKKTKRSEKEVDIKPMIYDFNICSEKQVIIMFLATGSEQNLKPDLVMKAFLRFAQLEEEDFPMAYHRLDVFGKNQGFKKNAPEFLPLGAFGVDISVAES